MHPERQHQISFGKLSGLYVRFRILGPDVIARIALTDTWLDDSVASVNIPGYYSVSRRDCNDGRQGGGIALYAAERTRYIGHIEDSIDAERSWHTYAACRHGNDSAGRLVSPP